MAAKTNSKEIVPAPRAVVRNDNSAPAKDVELPTGTHFDAPADLVRLVPLSEIVLPDEDGLVEDGARFNIKDEDRQQLSLFVELAGGIFSPVLLIDLKTPTKDGRKQRALDGAGRILDAINKRQSKIPAIVLPYGDPREDLFKFSPNISVMPPSAAERVNAIGRIIRYYETHTGTTGSSKRGGRNQKGTAAKLAERLPLSKKQINKINGIYERIVASDLRKVAGSGLDTINALNLISQHDEKTQKLLIQYASDNPAEKSVKKALESLGIQKAKDQKPAQPPTDAEQRLMIDQAWDGACDEVRRQWLKDNGFMLVDMEGVATEVSSSGRRS